MAKTFRCKLITPEAQVLSEPCTAAVVPAWDGQLGILPGRAALVHELGAGELRLDFPDSGAAKGGSRSYFVAGGFVQMLKDELTILAQQAIPAENLKESEAQAEVAELNARSTQGMSGAQRDELTTGRQRAAAKLSLARSARGRDI